MRILSNLADESLVTARMHVRPEQLATRDMSGEAVAAGIVTTSRIAAADPHRAATHNKGIMNGIDPVDGHVARGGREIPSEHSERGGLACTVRTEEADDLAGLDSKRHRVDCQPIAIAPR